MNTTTIRKNGGGCALLLLTAVALVMSGCATPLAPRAYWAGYASDKDYTPRSVPATVTQENEVALLQGGYYQQGIMKVWFEGGSDRDTRFIHEFAEAAAQHGGDVFRLEGEEHRELAYDPKYEGAHDSIIAHHNYTTLTLQDRVVRTDYVTYEKVRVNPQYNVTPHSGWARAASIWRYDPQGVDDPPGALRLSPATTDSDLAALVHVKWIQRSLNSLSLNSAGVTDAGLASLKELKGLAILYLQGTSVTDAGLENLKELKGLKMLWLINTKVTDAGLASLKELKGLTHLYLPYSKVTDAGLASLRAALPNTAIQLLYGNLNLDPTAPVPRPLLAPTLAVPAPNGP